MTVKINKDSGICKLSIGGEMNIYNAAELKNKLLNSLVQCGKLEIDLSGVSEMDTAGFQLLLMLKKESNALRKTMKIVSFSASTQAIIELYRLKNYLET